MTNPSDIPSLTDDRYFRFVSGEPCEIRQVLTDAPRIVPTAEQVEAMLSTYETLGRRQGMYVVFTTWGFMKIDIQLCHDSLEAPALPGPVRDRIAGFFRRVDWAKWAVMFYHGRAVQRRAENGAVETVKPAGSRLLRYPVEHGRDLYLPSDDFWKERRG